MTPESFNLAVVVAVQDDLVTFQMAETNPKPLLKNEVVYICPQRQGGDYEEKLKAGEVWVYFQNFQPNKPEKIPVG